MKKKKDIIKSIYVDPKRGKNRKGDGSFSNPFKTMKRALKEIPTITLLPETYCEEIKIPEYLSIVRRK